MAAYERKIPAMSSEKNVDHERLIRIDERTINIENLIDDMKNNYVTNDRFEPVRKIVYGMVGVTLLSVVGWIFTLIKK